MGTISCVTPTLEITIDSQRSSFLCCSRPLPLWHHVSGSVFVDTPILHALPAFEAIGPETNNSVDTAKFVTIVCNSTAWFGLSSQHLHPSLYIFAINAAKRWINAIWVSGSCAYMGAILFEFAYTIEFHKVKMRSMNAHKVVSAVEGDSRSQLAQRINRYCNRANGY